ncbi:MAG: response regulator [Chloroflexi bacterium]|nr:response regulator [Chloroflexota bacterium]
MSAPVVLIVDDEPGITKLCERLLTREGFDTVAYTDSRRAMEHLRNGHVDLLLVDIRMPDIDGFDVVVFAKQHQPDIAILVMTGFGTVETAIRALRQGVDGLILKPFERGEELVRSVRQALADNQRKRDAAHMQALRPLFDVTEALLAETRPDRLPDLIVNAVCGHLRCGHAGYYQYSADDQRLHLLAGQGKFFPDDESGQDAGVVGRTNELGVPVWINAPGPGDPVMQTQLTELGLGSALCVPISQSSVRGVLYAGRDADAAPFREVDLDMLLILARQAAVAMENAHLYAELRDYVKRVEESQQALLQAEKMAAAGRLTASIAHEINNPLQAVQNCLHLAGRDDLTPQKRDEYFDLARTELERLMTTVQRMLEFYRPGAVAPQRVDLADILKHVLGLMASQFENRGIEIITELPGKLPAVMAVGAQLQQVFLNLILNAYDAMPSGGVLRVSARKRKGVIEILFQDSGSGVLPEQSANIFEPFVSTKDGGTGLGLTVSYNIMATHGGDLEFVPNDEPGACFRVVLPIGGK